MIRLPIQQMVQKVQKCGLEITKPTTKPNQTIHYVDFEKLRKYKTSNVLKAKEIELKKIVK
jgi:hypothetical protein